MTGTRTTTRAGLCAWMLVGALSAMGADAHAQAPDDGAEAAPDPRLEEAKQAYLRATELYKTGDFKLALTEYERAYELRPTYKILYNIGQVNVQLNNFSAAVKAFEQYLREGGDEIDAERRAAIESELPTLRARTAVISVVSNEAGAEVRVDGELVGLTPLRDHRVDAGEHNVTVSKDGRSKTDGIKLSGGQVTELTIEIPVDKPQPVIVPPPPPIVVPQPIVPQPPIVRDRAVSPGVWIAWGVTGALTVAAVGTGVAAVFAQQDHDDNLGAPLAPGESPTKLEDSANKAMALSITTDVLIGSALVAGGVALFLTLTDGDDEEAAAPPMSVGVGPSGLSLRGHF